jgi:hypothetical protein
MTAVAKRATETQKAIGRLDLGTIGGRGIAQAANASRQFSGDMSRAARSSERFAESFNAGQQSAGGFAGTVISVGVAIGATRAAIDAFSAGMQAWRGNLVKVEEVLHRLPLGIGGLAQSLSGALEAWDGWNRAAAEAAVAQQDANIKAQAAALERRKAENLAASRGLERQAEELTRLRIEGSSGHSDETKMRLVAESQLRERLLDIEAERQKLMKDPAGDTRSAALALNRERERMEVAIANQRLFNDMAKARAEAERRAAEAAERAEQEAARRAVQRFNAEQGRVRDLRTQLADELRGNVEVRTLDVETPQARALTGGVIHAPPAGAATVQVNVERNTAKIAALMDALIQVQRQQLAAMPGFGAFR